MEETFQILKNGMFRKQYTDPVTKKRCSLTAATKVELMARLDDLQRLGRDLRYGAVSAADAIRTRLNITNEILTVAQIWRDYAKTQKRKAISKADYDVRIAPWLASCRRGISANAVDLPAPEGPTSAMVRPGAAVKVRPSRPMRPSG